MSIDRDIALLRGIATFDLLSDGAVRLLAQGAEEMRLAEGDVLFRMNETSDGAFVVVSGRLKMMDERVARRPAPAEGRHRRRPRRRDRPHHRHPAAGDGRAWEETVVICLPREVFTRVLERYPEVTAKFRRAIARRLEGRSAPSTGCG